MIYFAYGLYLNPAQMLECSPGYRSLGAARLADHWFAFPRYSSAVRSATIGIVENPGGVVWGALYELPEEDMPILDHLHGFDPDGPPNLNEHVIRDVSVQRPGHPEPIAAMTYVAVADGRNAAPSARYMTLLLDGARYHSLPKAYVAALQSVKTTEG